MIYDTLTFFENENKIENQWTEGVSRLKLSTDWENFLSLNLKVRFIFCLQLIVTIVTMKK